MNGDAVMDALKKGRHDVFISYSTKNKNVADAVVADFEQNGIKCWYAPRDILPGEEWVTAITNALEGSKALVLIFTEESNNSRQVMNEIAVAFNAGLTIVPFKLTNDQMSSELEYYLTRVHWLDAVSKPLKKNIQALREYIEVIISAENGAAPVRSGSEEKNTSAGKKEKRFLVPGIILVAVLLVVLIFAGIRGYRIVERNKELKVFGQALGLYYDGTAGFENSESAREAFEAISDSYPDKYYYLGMIGERGYDYEAALENYKIGIDKGSRLSLLGMGNLYLNGYAVTRDVVKAKEYFDNALSAGCLEANYYEALMCEEGFVSTEGADHKKAIEYLSVLTEGDDPMTNGRTDVDLEIVAKAFVLLGDIYGSGNAGPDKDIDDATKCYSNALSRCYLLESVVYGHTGDLCFAEGQYDKALVWYENGVEMNDRYAMKQLGDMYYDGTGTEMDEEKAIEYYLKASDYSFDASGLAFYDGYRGGVSDGEMLNRIGLYYFYEAEYENAAFFFMESADRFENVYAMANAAMAFENMMDWENAFKWYSKAIDAGHEDADKYGRRIQIMIDDGLVSGDVLL